MIYVDANYWIYWFDERLPEHKYVLELMRNAIHEGIITSIITLMEIAHYFRYLPKQDFRKKLDTIQDLATLKLISLDLNLARLAFEELIKYAEIGVGSRDSVILATMKATDVKRIASHDEVFTKIEGLETIDPIPKI